MIYVVNRALNRDNLNTQQIEYFSIHLFLLGFKNEYTDK